MDILTDLWRIVLPALGIVLAAAAGYAAKWLNAHAEAIKLNTKQEKTAIAVAATAQTMPDASGPVKLAATTQALGRSADRTLIEAAVSDAKGCSE